MEENKPGIVKIRVPNTDYWLVGEQSESGLWNTYLIDPPSSYKGLIKENLSTEMFARFSGIILKTPFPSQGIKYYTQIEKEEFKLLDVFNKNPELKQLILSDVITDKIIKAIKEKRFTIY